MAIYDTIGKGYGNLRKQDPRIAKKIFSALGNSKNVVNVGAGTGSYEPVDRKVIAVEPSSVMLQQRPKSSNTKAVRATAEALPFINNSFDAALAVLTIHHWSNIKRGLDELSRVASDTVVIFTFDPSVKAFWLLDYFPEISEIDQQSMPPLADIQKHFGKCNNTVIPIPHDCIDGFLCAYWRRPYAYLDKTVRAAISIFSKIENPEPGLKKLKNDLETGMWNKRYEHILNLPELDLGYRLVVAQLN